MNNDDFSPGPGIGGSGGSQDFDFEKVLNSLGTPPKKPEQEMSSRETWDWWKDFLSGRKAGRLIKFPVSKNKK